jgi:hypothetical protein
MWTSDASRGRGSWSGVQDLGALGRLPTLYTRGPGPYCMVEFVCGSFVMESLTLACAVVPFTWMESGEAPGLISSAQD